MIKNLIANIRRILDWAVSLFEKPALPSEKITYAVNGLTQQRKQTREDAKETGAFVSIRSLVYDAKMRLQQLQSMKWPRGGEYVEVARYIQNVGTFVVGDQTLFRQDRVDVRARPYLLTVSLPKVKKEPDDIIQQDYVWIVRLTKAQSAHLGVFRGVVYSLGVGVPKNDLTPSYWTWCCYVKLSDDGIASVLMGQRERFVRVGQHEYLQKSYGKMSIDQAHDWPATLVCMLNAATMRDQHWSITVSDGHNKATYSIPQNDAPRLFAKRDKDGSKIFHAVAAHIRSDGTVVKQHYRGNRRFVMDGLSVTIQVPGKHRRSLTSLPAFADSGTNEPTISISDASVRIGAAMDR